MNIEKKENEHREDSILIAHFRIIFRLSEIKTNAWKELFWNVISSTSVKLSIKILSEEIKQVLWEKFEFEDRDKSIALAFFLELRTIKIPTEELEVMVSQLNDSVKVLSFPLRPWWNESRL